MPRAYRLGRRAEQQADTRRRILAAALDLYRDGGYAAATTRAVADAADVALATVRNHFRTPLDLAVAAGEQVLEDLRPPNASILDGLATISERIERLTGELVAFFDRSEHWWWMLQRNPELSEAWTGAARAYEEGFARLLQATLGPLADDPVAMAVTANAVGPPLHYALRGAGVSSADAVDAQRSVIIPWLESRLEGTLPSEASRRRTRRRNSRA
jgi:AcrR family transcriptional regulator